MFAAEPSTEIESVECALSLLFASGARPTAKQIAALAGPSTGPVGDFVVSHAPPHEEGWLELTTQGLSFDLSGLHPGRPAPSPSWRHAFGLDGPELPVDLEAVRLTAGAHLSGGGALLPVVRAITGMAAALMGFGGVRAVCWHPAGTCVETVLFSRIVKTWLAGGAFPVHGFMALRREAGVGVRSEGLAFFIGQELHLESGRDAMDAETANVAVGLIQDLIEDGPLHSPCQLVATDGECFDAEPSRDGRVLRVWRRVSD